MLCISSTDNPRKLSQAVIQVIDCLNMYQAELARVLNVQCTDIGLLSSGKRCIEPGSDEWRRASLFIRMYQALYVRFDGDGAAMIHWLRTDNKTLKQSPHLLIVDENKLAEVVEHLEKQQRALF